MRMVAACAEEEGGGNQRDRRYVVLSAVLHACGVPVGSESDVIIGS